MDQKKDRKMLRDALADCVVTLRTRRGIAQEKLAYKAGIDRAYMGGLERGLHSPTIETLHKIVETLGINYIEFAEQYERSLKKIRKQLPLVAALLLVGSCKLSI